MKKPMLFNTLLSRMTPDTFQKMKKVNLFLTLSTSLYFLSAFVNALFIQPTSAISPLLKTMAMTCLPSANIAPYMVSSHPALSIFLLASMVLMVPVVLTITFCCLDIIYLTRLSQTLCVARGTMASLMKALQEKAQSITSAVILTNLVFLLPILLPLSSLVVQPTLVLISLIALHLLLLCVMSAATYGVRFMIVSQARQSLTNSLSPDIISES